MTTWGNSPVTRSALLGLYDIGGKPRSRSEWEDSFATWQRPASETEEDMMQRAETKVREALAESRWLANLNWSIVRQGSYYNRTNVRTDSDIDLCVMTTDAAWYEWPDGQMPPPAIGAPPAFNYAEYRQKVVECLQTKFGTARVDDGPKAIEIDKEIDGRVSVDVVPAYNFAKLGGVNVFTGERLILATGVAFFVPGKTITNFPVQHHANGNTKNTATGRRFKRVVRILKRMRNHILANPNASAEMKAAANSAKSFFIESMVYNCPDRLFGHDKIYDDVTDCLGYLRRMLGPVGALAAIGGNGPDTTWYEVNGIKLLFRSDQAWTKDNGYNFANACLRYMGE